MIQIYINFEYLKYYLIIINWTAHATIHYTYIFLLLLLLLSVYVGTYSLFFIFFEISIQKFKLKCMQMQISKNLTNVTIWRLKLWNWKKLFENHLLLCCMLSICCRFVFFFRSCFYWKSTKKSVCYDNNVNTFTNTAVDKQEISLMWK